MDLEDPDLVSSIPGPSIKRFRPDYAGPGPAAPAPRWLPRGGGAGPGGPILPAPGHRGGGAARDAFYWELYRPIAALILGTKRGRALSLMHSRIPFRGATVSEIDTDVALSQVLLQAWRQLRPSGPPARTGCVLRAVAACHDEPEDGGAGGE